MHKPQAPQALLLVIQAAVLAYVAGELLGRWLHRANDQLARVWVQLVVSVAQDSPSGTTTQSQQGMLPVAQDSPRTGSTPVRQMAHPTKPQARAEVSPSTHSRPGLSHRLEKVIQMNHPTKPQARAEVSPVDTSPTRRDIQRELRRRIKSVSSETPTKPQASTDLRHLAVALTGCPVNLALQLKVPTPAAPMQHPLAEVAAGLQRLTAVELRSLLGTRQRCSKAQLVAMACCW